MPPKRKVVRIAPKGLPAEPPAEGVTEVYWAQDQAEALVVKGLFEAHGIACALRTRIVQSVHPFTVADLGAVQILVAARDQAQAARLLSTHRRSS